MPRGHSAIHLQARVSKVRAKYGRVIDGNAEHKVGAVLLAELHPVSDGTTPLTGAVHNSSANKTHCGLGLTCAMARDSSRFRQLTTLRFTGPSRRHEPSAWNCATSTDEHSGSQQQLVSHAWARRLQTQPQSNLEQGLQP